MIMDQNTVNIEIIIPVIIHVACDMPFPLGELKTLMVEDQNETSKR